MKKRNNIKFSKNNNDTFDKIDLKFPEHGRIGIQGLTEIEADDFSQILLGFKKSTAGSIWIDGEDILSYSKEQAEEYRRDKIGLLLKNPRMQMLLSVLENVEYPLWLKNDKDAEAKATKELTSLGLSSYRNQMPYDLSKENLQKASLARAIAKDSKVILANDPFSFLSEESANELAELLKEESKKRLIILECSKASAINQYLDFSIVYENKSLISSIPLSESAESSIKTPNTKHKDTLESKHSFSIAWKNRKSNKFLLSATILTSGLALAFSGVYSLLRLKSDTSLTADSMIGQKEDYCSLFNYYASGNSKQYAFFSDSNVDSLSKKLSLPFLKVIENFTPNAYYEGNPVFTERKYNPDSSDGINESYFDFGNMDYRYACLDSREKLPSDYKLIAGRLPEKDNEIRLTDFQVEVLSYTSGKRELSPNSLINKKITLCNTNRKQILPELTITGVLDTVYDSKDFKEFKDYCLNQKTDISSNKVVKDERNKLYNLKNDSYINIFFVSRNVFEDLKKSYCFHYDNRTNNYFILDQKPRLPDDSDLYSYEYLREANKKKIQLFQDSNYDSDDFLSLSLQSYIRGLKEAGKLDQERNIVIPKKFLEQGATTDFTYTGSPYDFFYDFIRFPIHTYSIDYYKNAINEKEFDFETEALNYYKSLNTSAPSRIPEEDKPKIYEQYLTKVFEYGIPDYSVPGESKAFSEIYSLGRKRLSYYRNYYKDSIFSERDLSYQYNDKETNENKILPFRLSGLTLINTDLKLRYPIRKEETLSKIYYDGGATYSTVLTPITNRTTLRELISRQSRRYSNHNLYLIRNYSAYIDAASNKKQRLSTWFLILAVLSMIAAAILGFYFFKVSLFILSIDAYYQKCRGTTENEIRKEAIFSPLLTFLSSFLLSIAFRYIVNAILKSCLITGYPSFRLLSPGYIQILILLLLSLLLAILTSLPSLLALKSKVERK